MATIKSHTDLEQCKRLKEILSTTESADMFCSDVLFDGKHKYGFYYLETYGFKTFEDTKSRESKNLSFLPCWSLAALIGMFTEYTFIIMTDGNEFKIDIPIRHCKWFPSLLDAAFELVVWLKMNPKI